MAMITLSDGRRLELEISGPAGGTPLVFHHGTPGSVVPLRAVQQAAYDRGLRVVTFSRAGYGNSTRQPGRRVVDAAADVAAVLDYLDARRCVVAGWSGGGPHALATAARLRERVAGVLVIAGVAPHDAAELDWLAGMGATNVEEFRLARQGEAALRPFVDGAQGELGSIQPSEFEAGLDTLLAPADVTVLPGEFGEDLAAQLRASVRLSADGWLDDDLAFVAPWGFELDELAVPAYVWQGSEDLMVPFAHGQWLAGHLPGVTAHLEPGEGHLSILARHTARMLDELVCTL